MQFLRALSCRFIPGKGLKRFLGLLCLAFRVGVEKVKKLNLCPGQVRIAKVAEELKFAGAASEEPRVEHSLASSEMTMITHTKQLGLALLVENCLIRVNFESPDGPCVEIKDFRQGCELCDLSQPLNTFDILLVNILFSFYRTSVAKHSNYAIERELREIECYHDELSRLAPNFLPKVSNTVYRKLLI